MRATRKKGRVVLVGDIGLNLNRGDFYQKELDFFISTSYGPGRYDPFYEEGGQDYPLPYVRWTENRNMQAYLQLLATGRVRLGNLLAAPFSIDNATDAYASLNAEGPKPLIVLLKYSDDPRSAQTRIDVRAPVARSGAIRVGLVGASSFAQGMHLPNMQKLGNAFTLQAVMSRTGSNAKAVAEQYGARYCTTLLDELLADKDVDLVMITSRHDLHGSSVLRALQAGKHVFVEKPLTLEPSDLDQIEAFYREQPNGPMLMVGYNRRFAPAVTACLDILRERTTPLIVNYRMNAGYIPRDHWVHGPEGGGRNLGEACHIYDLFNALVGGAAPLRITANAIRPSGPQWGSNDNFIATIAYEDGSVCSLTYTALGDKAYPKERMDVFADGKVLSLDDYKNFSVAGGRFKSWSSSSAQKGQMEELKALAETLACGKPWPISLDQLVSASRISFAVENQIRGN